MSKDVEIMDTVEQYGLAAKGKKEIIKHLCGERLTIRQMVIAKCYDCMGYYSDGRGTDCEIPNCPLYPLMPYRKSGEKYTTRNMTDEQRKKAGDRMRKIAI